MGLHGISLAETLFLQGPEEAGVTVWPTEASAVARLDQEVSTGSYSLSVGILLKF